MSHPFDNEKIRSAFGAAGISHKPGLANNLLQDMAPLLAEEGIDVNDPSSYDMATLNVALARAVERTNLERFTPHGKERASALALLRQASEAIADGQDDVVRVAIEGLKPEGDGTGTATIAQVIGVALGLLDSWYGDQKLRPALTATRIPRWNSRGKSAATDVIVLARKGRAFDSIGALHGKYNGFEILEGGVLAVAGSLNVWASHDKTSVRELGKSALG